MTLTELQELLPYLTPQERAEMDKLLTGLSLPLWRPWPNRPQEMGYNSPADVLGFGGAAGGGKTDLLLGLAATRHLKSIIFRREAVQGRGMIDRARELFGKLGRFNENSGLWRNLPGGRQIEFAGVKDAGDEEKYRGRPHDLIGFDEADQFSRFQFEFLTGWLRTTTPNQRCRIVLTFNPPSSAEGRWLLDYFGPWLDKKHPRPARPGELRWYARLPDAREIEREDGTPFTFGDYEVRPMSRTFVPSRVLDNPALMATDYPSKLAALPEPLRSQLLNGDFSAGVSDDPWQVIPTAWVEAAQARWTPDGAGKSALSCLGVDVARGGSAKTVLSPRHGAWFAPLQKHPGRDTPDGQEVFRLVQSALAPNPKAIVNVDVIGVGASVYDLCRAGGQWNVKPFNAAASCDKRDRAGVLKFRNMRAYAWWHLREALDPVHGDGIALPPDPELLADLTAPRWSMTLSGVLVEAKEDVADRLKRSTDCGDAVVMAAIPAPDMGGWKIERF